MVLVPFCFAGRTGALAVRLAVLASRLYSSVTEGLFFVFFSPSPEDNDSVLSFLFSHIVLLSIYCLKFL